MKVKKYQNPSGPIWKNQTPVGEDWRNEWKYRLTPASRSKVAGGWSSKGKVKKTSESGELYTKRRVKEETKRTWRSDAADIAHGIGEGVLALHPYTAIPYYGAKVGQDVLNGNVNWETALNASIPLFHLSPQAVGLREATNVALEDAANAGSKTARNWRVAREINLVTKNKPNIEVPKSIIRTRVGDVEIDNPGLNYRLVKEGAVKNFEETERQFAPIDENATGINAMLLDVMGGTPMYKQGSLWYGLNPEYYPELFVTSEPLAVANKHANIVNDYTLPGRIVRKGIRSGEVSWDITPIEQKGRRVPFTDTLLNYGNVASYKWKPGYGYKLVVEEPSTSLKFFERRSSELTEAERLGVPKGERNFSPRWHVARYPGYQLKGLMGGSPLERQISKNGTISINLLNAHFNKASQTEREIISKVLNEKFAGLKIIDYNLLKKAVLDELIGAYDRVPQTEWADYGMDRLGINPSYNIYRDLRESYPDRFTIVIDGQGRRLFYDTETGITYPPTPIRTLLEKLSFKPHLIKLNTFTFESPRIPYGNTKHYGGNPIGHSRTYVLPEDPHTLYVMESQSDWAQQGLRRKGSIDAQAEYDQASQAALMRLQEIDLMKANLENGLAPDGRKIQHEGERADIEEIIRNTEKQLSSNNARAARFDAILHPEKYILENHLKQNYLQRLLQENLRYASENGLTKMRYPTSETAAKIEGYSKESFLDPKTIDRWKDLDKERMLLYNEKYELGIFDPRYDLITKRLNEIKQEQEYLATLLDYSPEHKTILKKYADFPKLFLKLFKDSEVRVVTDTNGNTWYEIDVPKGYLGREWQYKQGGKFSKLEFLKLMKYES